MRVTKRVALFEDLEFHADHNSLGELKGKVAEWRRVPDIFRTLPDGVQLFSDRIEPKDIIQGAVGNSWLLASLAALSEHPKLIKKIFRHPRNYNDEPTLSPDGHYILRFFDIELGAYLNIDIDDRIPCGADGLPVFARANGPEAWVMLLEKAMAKYCGSYQEMSGGWSVWALRTLTGYSCAGFNSWKGSWTPVRPVTRVKGARFGRMFRERKLILDPKDKYKERTLVNRLITWINDDNYGYVFSAGTKGSGDDTQMVKGLYKSHSYSIVAIVSVEPDLTLIQLRNPQGKGEWTGAWSVGDVKWQENTRAAQLAAEASPVAADAQDGSFWMHFEADFVQYFARVDMLQFDRPDEEDDEEEDGDDDDDGSMGGGSYCATEKPFNEYGNVYIPDLLPATNEEEIREQFDRIDQDGDGVISRAELREFLKALPDVRLTPGVISRLVDEVDVVKKPAVGISYREFHNAYSMDDGDQGDEWWTQDTIAEQVVRHADLARNYHVASTHFSDLL